MFTKRARPQTSRHASVADSVEESHTRTETGQVSVDDLIELRKYRQSRQGIDTSKLGKGDGKRKRDEQDDNQAVETVGGLWNTLQNQDEDGSDDRKARKAVRSNNFTQQTNALDVDKHMMAYIEENLKLRQAQARAAQASKDDPGTAAESVEELFKTIKSKQNEDGNVTNSIGMLTAIPEVDLGMDTRLKNIEETEKAKRFISSTPQNSSRPTNLPRGEEHLAATRFYMPHLKQQSDQEILRKAKLEAAGMPVSSDRNGHPLRHQTATDEIVMERFKKRMSTR